MLGCEGRSGLVWGEVCRGVGKCVGVRGEVWIID